jgi:hypothetical protein
VRYAERAVPGAKSCAVASLWNAFSLKSCFRCLLWITALASLYSIDHQSADLCDSDMDLKGASV